MLNFWILATGPALLALAVVLIRRAEIKEMRAKNQLEESKPV